MAFRKWHRAMDIVGVQDPVGLFPGQQFMVQTSSGQSLVVTVPYGIAPGSTMYVKVPRIAPMPTVMAQAPKPEEEQAPPEKEKVFTPKVYDARAMKEAPNPEELTPFASCCCVITSCYCSLPKCLGVYSKGLFTCLQVEVLCCKTPIDDGSLCLCTKSEIECVKPEVCCKLTHQQFCCVQSCAFPCDAEVPCMMTLLGVTCVRDYKCHCVLGDKIAKKDDDQAV